MPMKRESALRLKIRSWKEYETGLVSFVEPGLGADTGIADCLFTRGPQCGPDETVTEHTAGTLVPIELKRGKSVVKELRPSQRAWHRAQLHAGLSTYGLLLRPDDTVFLLQLSLSGGLMSELIEEELASWPLEDLSFNSVINVIPR